jgi:hypothetical protein
MLSIITCSVNPKLLSQLSDSIKSTVFVPYEIIAFDNSISKYSITYAYNFSASKAKYQNLVFVHEDVEFLKSGWADKLISILQNKNIGIVGVAGSTYLPSVPSGWYLPDEQYNKVFIHQGFKYKVSSVRFDNQGEDMTPVFLLDGVFLGMRSDVYKEFPFNDSLEGFHGYDVDISQRISTKYSNMFTNQIEILHHSEGKIDQSYFDAILNYKNAMLSFQYSKRIYYLEFQMIQHFYSHLRCFYDRSSSIMKIKPFFRIKYLGWKNFFNFLFLLINDK